MHDLHHLTLKTVGRRSLTRGELELREAVRRLVRCGGERLLLFSIVDDHAHVLARTARPHLLARSLVRSLQAGLPAARFERTHRRPVETRQHLRSLVGYFLRQPSKHSLQGVHPALWTGSGFLDLAGLRVLESFSPAAIRSELPRLDLAAHVHEVRLPAWPIPPAPDGQLRDAGVARLLETARAVLAVARPDARTRPALDARALTVQVSLAVGFRPSGVLPFVGGSERTLRRLAQRSVDGACEGALRRRLTLEDHLRRGDRAA